MKRCIIDNNNMIKLMNISCEMVVFMKRILLSSPTMHGEEQQFVKEAFDIQCTWGDDLNKKNIR